MSEKGNGWSKNIFLRFQIGLIISLALTLTAFEWKDYGPDELVDLGSLEDDMFEEAIVPITVQPPKQRPKPKVQPIVIEVEEEPEVEEILDFEFDEDIEIAEEVVVEPDLEPEEIVEEPFILVPEVAAVPQEGMTKFLKFLAKNIKYPTTARRMAIEGKVFIQFIIEKDGSLSDLQVVRGIGAGCDEEAMRVLKKSKKWNPARQRGKAVRQRMVLPINFRLN